MINMSLKKPQSLWLLDLNVALRLDYQPGKVGSSPGASGPKKQVQVSVDKIN